MKTLFCAVLICMPFSMAKGQCLDDNNFRIVSSCDGSMRSGSYVFVDMNKIGRPCTCTVNSLFIGDLLVTSLGVTTQLCYTRVIVNNTIVFYCNQTTSSTFKVGVNDTIIVKAEHMSKNITDRFTQCLGFIQNGRQGGKLSVTCGTPADSTTTPLVFTVTTSSTLGSKFPMKSNIGVIALSATGGIVLLISIVVFSFVMLRRKNRQKKAKSPEVDASLSYMVFDSRNKPSDNHLYATCQTVEEVELNVKSKQNQETVSSQHTALNTMHRIGPDYDVPLSDEPVDRDTSSMCLYEVPYANCMIHDSSPMPLNAIPNNSFIKRGPLPTLMNAAINVSIKSKPEK